MRSYLIDQIKGADIEKITVYLEENARRSHLENLFWVELPQEVLSPPQSLHVDCLPYVFSIEIGTDWIKFELLIRTLKSMGCDCGGYATELQRDYITRYADKMIKDLRILT